jgi:hypothetical protein
MTSSYIRASYKSDGFNCPHCKVFAHQKWYIMLHAINDEVKSLPSFEKDNDSIPAPIPIRCPAFQNNIMYQSVYDTSLSRCSFCSKYAFWIKGKLIYPVVSLAPMPSDDMPDDVKADYIEAMPIVEVSPRASSALLRLALQKLMPYLGENGKDLNVDIGNLIKKGLPLEVQQSLDCVRVIGNESVHPGTLDLKDDKDTAYSLFDLLNFIVYDRITKPKEIAAIYNKLPNKKLDGIKERDSKK